MAKILLVEDQKFIAEIVETALKSGGHSVLWVKDGVQGLAAFTANRPQLVITDIVMPEMDGIAFIRAVRAQASEVPIIALSGGGRTRNYEFLDSARRAGANEAIRKPISRDDLLAAVDRCLAGGDADQEAAES